MADGEIGIELRFSGNAALTRRLSAMQTAVADMTPVWGVLRNRFVATMAMEFAGQRSASGKWKPLSPAYGAWKAQHYGGKPILQRTGELYGSLTGDLAIDIREPQMMVLGTDVSYARFHQTGTKKMPARPIIDLSESERMTWVELILQHLMASDTTQAVLAA